MRKLTDKYGLTCYEYVFRLCPVKGNFMNHDNEYEAFVDVNDPDLLLCDLLSKYDLIIDDRCHFARFYDYDRKIKIEYRSYYDNQVRINIYELDPKYF